MNTNWYTETHSPIGPLLLTANAVGLTGLFMQEGPHGAVPIASTWVRDDDRLASVRTQIDEYFAGRRQRFDVALDLEGTPFQKTVWTALCDIGFGETSSYGELARRIGNPNAMRAVGLANGRNPVAIIVPCHRVIGADGSMTGYGGGVERKRFLLELESRQRPLA